MLAIPPIAGRHPVWRLAISSAGPHVGFIGPGGGFAVDPRTLTALRITPTGLKTQADASHVAPQERDVGFESRLAFSPADGRLACYFPGGMWVAAPDGGRLQLDSADARWSRRRLGHAWLGLWQFEFSPDGSEIRGARQHLWRWRTDPLRLLDPVPPRGVVGQGLVVAPDGRTAVVFEPAPGSPPGRRFRFHDLAAGRDWASAAITGGDLTGGDTSAFSPDGRFFAYFFRSRLWVWEVPTARLLFHRSGGPHCAGAAFGSDGQALLVAQGPAVHVFSTRSWQATASYNWGIGRLSSLAVAPHGQTAAAGSQTGHIVLWDLD